MDATRDGILMLDAETLRFTYANQGAIDQLGYSRHELLGMTMLHIAPEYTEERLRELLEPLERGEISSTTITTLHRRRDGSDMPVEIAIQAAAMEDGRPRVFVKVVRDIRDRLAAEQQVRRSDRELRLIEERERIGRDLHDTVVQRLFAAGMSLQAASSLMADRPEALERVGGVVEELDQTIREIRTAIYGLQTPIAGRGGLRNQILAVISGEREALGADPHLSFKGLLDLVPDTIVEQLLPTLREALSNVARHAAASSVDVEVEAGADVVLRVVDDGIGVSAQLVMGNGVRNMSERARRLGGTLTLGTAGEHGTRLEWKVPNG